MNALNAPAHDALSLACSVPQFGRRLTWDRLTSRPPKTGRKEQEVVAGSLAGPAQRPTNQDIKSNRWKWSTPAASSFRDFLPRGAFAVTFPSELCKFGGTSFLRILAPDTFIYNKLNSGLNGTSWKYAPVLEVPTLREGQEDRGDRGNCPVPDRFRVTAAGPGRSLKFSKLFLLPSLL